MLPFDSLAWYHVATEFEGRDAVDNVGTLDSGFVECDVVNIAAVVGEGIDVYVVV